MSDYAAYAEFWADRSHWWDNSFFRGMVVILFIGVIPLGIALLIDPNFPLQGPILGVTVALAFGWGSLAMFRREYAEDQFLQFRRMQLMDEQDPSDG